MTEEDVVDFNSIAEKIRKGDSTKADPSWLTKLTRSERGIPHGNVHNVIQPLRHEPIFKDRIWLNELTRAAECARMPWDKSEGTRPWTDADDVHLASWMQGADINASPGTCADAVLAVAGARRIHPVRQWLDGLVWDGRPRLQSLLSDFLICMASDNELTGDAVQRAEAQARDAPYLAEVGKCTLLSAVARAYRPGCKVDHVTVFKGKQGILKSTAIAALCPEPRWFTDEISDLGTKDSAQDLLGKWIVELAELAATRKADREKLKAFITRSVDHYRPSYGRRSQDFPRQCVFIGTTNADTFLVDETGNRRFWPVTVLEVDLEAIRRDRDQLWAEAVVLFKGGVQWWLDPEIEKRAAEVQAAHVVRDPWHEDVVRWATGKYEIKIEEALAHLGVETAKRTQRDQNRVSAILKSENWRRIQKRIPGGRRRWVYVPPNDGTK